MAQLSCLSRSFLKRHLGLVGRSEGEDYHPLLGERILLFVKCKYYLLKMMIFSL